MHTLQRVRQEYEKEGALRGHIQPVEFATDKITLDIPMEGTSCTGWTISPLFPPVVCILDINVLFLAVIMSHKTKGYQEEC